MEAFASRFIRKPIQELQVTLAALRRTGAARLKRVRRWRRWFMRGVIVGATWTLLSAPQSGTETRQAVGRLLHPLAQQGTSVLTWLMRKPQVRQDRLVERRAPGRSGNTTEGWTTTRGQMTQEELVESERP